MYNEMYYNCIKDWSYNHIVVLTETLPYYFSKCGVYTVESEAGC
jgi:hypothetical protein